MKKINQLILRKCKSLSRQLGRSSSYNNPRSKSARDVKLWCGMQNDDDDGPRETIIVGSSRKRYVISSKHLSHPLLNALVQKSSLSSSKQKPGDGDGVIQVKCEVVLFDHLLWMLDNAEPSIGPESLEELAELYVF
ncbi:hypothetical protein BT93_H2284 [Corymbia citriodora subsp. variegata]|nr:hypothetical protein BT93_H2284 [Corymbia citriodora subsp. variegata]